MRKNKYTLIILLFLLLKTTAVLSQSKTSETLINNFVKSVFFEKNKADFIAENYIYFEPVINSKYTISDRIKILDKHLKKLNMKKKSLIDSSNYFIVEYKDYKGTKILFDKSTDNIYILISKNNPIMYFYLSNDKIFSFDYIIKGNEGLFITY
ncbi:hypothetical protein [Flavobacterium bizetiae]|uniref:hypothetical protein n=1 Tax=Flavobacterium bizetiae TaxID=2704140 RepID=UPI001749A21C|nr:hypothetical protein [Flavobacterium bizetiae]CAD5343337.1 hypothetical protein FLA105535_03335 [Flavobacterium bizetiae]CAD5349330.1 hypothetical protein FLA105534_03314 [Flavobacterium bizetiae]